MEAVSCQRSPPPPSPADYFTLLERYTHTSTSFLSTLHIGTDPCSRRKFFFFLHTKVLLHASLVNCRILLETARAVYQHCTARHCRKHRQLRRFLDLSRTDNRRFSEENSVAHLCSCVVKPWERTAEGYGRSRGTAQCLLSPRQRCSLLTTCPLGQHMSHGHMHTHSDYYQSIRKIPTILIFKSRKI